MQHVKVRIRVVVVTELISEDVIEHVGVSWLLSHEHSMAENRWKVKR